MAVEDLKEQIARLPEQPGVYVWANAAGETLYVGKARSLRDRVRSYLGAHGLSPRHDALIDEIAQVEVIVTDSVMEALVLEDSIVKQRAPKYNIRLRDDKNYPYLQLTTSEAYPRVLVARSVERGGDYYAGPFVPAKIAPRGGRVAERVELATARGSVAGSESDVPPAALQQFYELRTPPGEIHLPL